ncbi:rod shape-determining protein RodA [Candidatus Daviesbacteria bacterium]|nr:rod shape-determining protein RodA [Candidatus Daviesbacteria bacterium]
MGFLSLLYNPLTLGSALLLSISILIIYSSSVNLAFQQASFVFFGFIIYFLVSKLDYRILKNFSIYAYIFTILLLLIVLALGIETRGSVRWIPLGFFNIQPSELAKPVLILMLANFWSKSLPSWRNIGISLLIALPVVFLVFEQPDLGSALTIFAIWVGMLIPVKISFKKLLVLLVILILMAPVGWFSLEDYQKQRIFSFLSPYEDPLGIGYNIIQSTIAVGSGQFLGRGLGHGTQSRLQFLPESRTDFIFAFIAEELGFMGAMIIIGLHVFLIYYLFKIADQARDKFGYLIIFGIVSMLFFQSFVNVGMNIGILPITGITLPLVSYGGSSLLATLLSLGLVLSIARYRKKIDSESIRVDISPS